MKKTIREAHLQLCHWVRLLSQPTTTWSPLHWEFENPPCSFNVAKTNAICESVYSPWTGGSKKQIQFSDLKNDHLWKKNTNALSWESVISSASQSSQIHNITAPPEEMLFRCLERRLNLNLMLGPGLPQKASTFETMHFHRPLSCGQRCVDVNNIIKICWEGNQQLLKGCKNHFHEYWNMSWKHVFLLSLRLTEKIVADSPSRLRLCVLIGCWKIALLRLPKFQLWDTKPVTWRQWTPATSSDCRPETSCCASFPCSLWTIEIKH